MSNERTNKEWIDDNNLKIDEIKTIAQNLPEYQDIEPIYRSSTLTTNRLSTYGAGRFDIYEDYLLYSTTTGSGSSIKYFCNIAKINTDGSLTVLYTATSESNKNAIHNIIYGIKNGKLYFTNDLPDNWHLDVYDLDLETFEINKTSIPYPTGSWSYAYLSDAYYIGMGNFKVTNGANDSILHFDLETMSLSTKSWSSDNRYGLMREYSPYYVGKAYTYASSYPYTNRSIYSVVSGVPNLSSFDYENVTFININCDKILMRTDNHLYELLPDGTLGTDLGEANIPTTLCLTWFESNFYYDSIGKVLYSFNEDTNKFTEEMNISNATTFSSYYVLNTTGGYMAYGSSGLPFVYIVDGYIHYFKFIPDTTKMIGFMKDGVMYRSTAYGYGQSSRLLSGNVLYNDDGTPLVGTMPNNGQLNYTPTTSQQTIPEGYTSGGNIAAVTSVIDSNIQAGNIKKDVEILGVTGTYEGSGGGSGSVKLFSTVADMEADTTAQEGDLAVVYAEDTTVEPAVYEFEGFYRYDGSQWIKLSIQGYYEIETNE